MCPENRALNKMMKEAFDREEKERAQVSACNWINVKYNTGSARRQGARKMLVSSPQPRLAELFDKVATLG